MQYAREHGIKFLGLEIAQVVLAYIQKIQQAALKAPIGF